MNRYQTEDNALCLSIRVTRKKLLEVYQAAIGLDAFLRNLLRKWQKLRLGDWTTRVVVDKGEQAFIRIGVGIVQEPQVRAEELVQVCAVAKLAAMTYGGVVFGKYSAAQVDRMCPRKWRRRLVLARLSEPRNRG